jgi:hypothetical protein
MKPTGGMGIRLTYAVYYIVCNAYKANTPRILRKYRSIRTIKRVRNSRGVGVSHLFVVTLSFTFTDYIGKVQHAQLTVTFPEKFLYG